MSEPRTFDDGNINIVGQVANLPQASGRLIELTEPNRYYAMWLYNTQDRSTLEDLKRTDDGRPYISKNVYCIWEQGRGATVIVEVKEVSKCCVLLHP